jgi:nucleoside-diphosphate-sugar epimerase
MALHLVTGGAGFIGSNIAGRLVQNGDRVRILDNVSTGSLQNLKDFREDIEFIEGDIRDEGTLKGAVKGVDCVFHQAALPSVQRSVQFPVESAAVNAMGTLQTLEASRCAGVRRVVYASSSSVYGNTPTLPKREDQPPNPLSPYAVSKLTGELYCRIYYNLHGLETVSLRYFNVFGPRQDPNSAYAAVIPRFIHALSNEESPVVYGDGDQTRDFTFVSNVVEANLLASTAARAPGGIFNVACSERTSLNSLLHHLERITGTSASAVHEPPRPGDVKDSLADIGQAQEKLDYRPATTLEEGLRKTVEWFQENAEILSKELNQST